MFYMGVVLPSRASIYKNLHTSGSQAVEVVLLNSFTIV